MWKRKRVKNNGQYFEEEQVWEHLPYQRPKFIIKLHRLRVWYRQRDRKTDQWNRENTNHSHGNTDQWRKAERTTQ